MFIQVWYNLSDREVADSLNDRISFLKFSEFLYENSTPSHSSICRYRNKIIKLGLYEDIFKLINQDLESKKIIDKKEVIVDSSIILSSRKPRKKLNKKSEI